MRSACAPSTCKPADRPLLPFVALAIGLAAIGHFLWEAMQLPLYTLRRTGTHAGHNDAHGTGTVNSVDPAQHKVNLSHNPIPEIGWPAMTMEFPVAPSIDLTAIKPGTRVNFTIEQQPGGMYEIRAITPAGGGR